MAALLGYQQADVGRLRIGAECLGEIDKKMGKTKMQWEKEGAAKWIDTANFVECGREVYCDNCTGLVEMLGNTWCLKSATEAVDLTLIALEKGYKARNWPKTGKIHICSNNCPLKKTKKQFDLGKRFSGQNETRVVGHKWVI